MKYFFTLLLSSFVIVIQAQPGMVDKSYGNNETGTISFYNQPYITSSAIQSDDKLLLGGDNYINKQFKFTVSRHNKDGSVDTSFGTLGQTAITFDDLVKDNIVLTFGLTAIAVQTDGKIVATGSVLSGDWDIVMVRLLADGTPDESFGSHGRLVTDLGKREYANSILVQPDGKLVVGGYQTKDIFDNTVGILLVRYNSDGSLDKTFGSYGGYALYTQQIGTRAYSLLLQPDNKIIAGGTTGDNNSFLLVRYLPDGKLDESFGNGGDVTTSFGAGIPGVQINSLAFDDLGRIAAIGSIGYEKKLV